jgi:hypothetical protein
MKQELSERKVVVAEPYGAPQPANVVDSNNESMPHIGGLEVRENSDGKIEILNTFDIGEDSEPAVVEKEEVRDLIAALKQLKSGGDEG